MAKKAKRPAKPKRRLSTEAHHKLAGALEAAARRASAYARRLAQLDAQAGKSVKGRFKAPLCRYCNSDETHIYKTLKSKRYVRCRQCGRTFAIGP